MKAKHYLPLILFLLVTFKAKAQERDLQFHNQNLLNLNSSFAGSNHSFRNQTIYQSQTPNLSKNLVSYSSAADFYLKRLNAGLGFFVQSNNWYRSTFVNNNYSIIYAQHLTFLDKKLKVIPSLQAAFFQRRLDVNSLTFGDPIDPEFDIYWNNRAFVPNERKNNLDYNAGLLTIYKTFYGGVAVKHFNQPDIGMSESFKLPMRINAHAAYSWIISPKNMLQFTAIYMKQGYKTHALVGINSILFKWFTAGISYGSFDRVNTTLGYRGKHFGISLGNTTEISFIGGNTNTSWTFGVAFSTNSGKIEETNNLRLFENW